MRTELFLKTASDLRDECEDYLNDSSDQLATPALYYSAMNRALSGWARRVLFPQLYTFSFSSGVFEYALPSYVRPPLWVEIRRSIYGFESLSTSSDSALTWQDFLPYDIKPTSTGGYAMHVHVYPYSEDGRITWFAENGRFPTGAVTSAVLTSTATSVVLTVIGSPVVGDSGYIKIDSEWIAYSGITRTSATAYTISNLVRGVYATVAASHLANATVNWGIGVDDERLWQQFYDRVGQYIHLLNMQKSSSEDMGRHEKLYVAFRDSADGFWRKEGYVTQRAPRLRLKRGALGSMPWM